jgi:hypothetical protein
MITRARNKERDTKCCMIMGVQGFMHGSENLAVNRSDKQKIESIQKGF